MRRRSTVARETTTMAAAAATAAESFRQLEHQVSTKGDTVRAEPVVLFPDEKSERKLKWGR